MAGTSGDAGESPERGVDDIPIHPNAEKHPTIRQPGFDIGRCLRIGPRTKRMLVVVDNRDIGDAGSPQSIDERVERAAAMAFDYALVAAIHDRRIDRAPVGIGKGAVFDEIDFALTEISLAKHGPDIRRAGLLASAVGPVLDDAAEFDLKRARQLQTVVGLQQIGDAALPRLAVDADHRLVSAAEILWIDWEIGHFPERVVALCQRLEALVDRVLVGARKRRVYQFAGIGMTWMHRQSVAILDRLDDRIDVSDAQLGINTLAEEIQCQGHEIDIAGSFAIAEQSALDPLGAGQDG